ncbi:MAG: hypothetical protein WCD89_06250 [Anaerocolumna sp.]
MVVNNNSSKKEISVGQNSIEVKVDIQSGEADANSIEKNTLSAAEVNTSEQDTAVTEKQSVPEEDIESEIKKLINIYYETPSDKNLTADDQTAEKSVSKNQTSENQNSIAEDKKNEIIEKYKNIKTYIKPGLDQDSYVVFTTYDIKLYNIDTLVPGMSSLSVIREESGDLKINSDTGNKKLNEYIIKLSKEKDITKVMKNVNSKLTAAIKKDNSLKEFIDYLK